MIEPGKYPMRGTPEYLGRATLESVAEATVDSMTRATEPDMPMHDPSLGSDPSETDGYARMPRWVKVFGIIALVVVLVFLFQLVTEGPMRPGMHGGGHGQAPPASVIAPNGPDGHNASDWGY